ncbi:putative cation/H+ exchanger, sodium/solute symporter superfamily [Helianthus annuus]|uniref:Cation/H+ exchanger, sodium/solute symporter superfamily n=2 Tax=Helianthus annuus TaxID=4232 RepID=A0A251UPB6_HELAN|nr:putative cation/H+ exchanger, sodium/solute symporter superfamily [Helianthus annuus]KAJ0569967.1 putative cation/H+ exchanger, sodium/solute symporter superfamily [Helianthus annuus]KAJ0584297.1 putative cation/H+ exchanger, sodium/solute symporter superfamily [Helianthus annuus]KAJ0746930.1 putative cation/H+ exchanger, sodium/solute symporter superfamily [Helianthus annuus]KAJ0918645.1 putative cation/H+ exchanger, sodium/solute symporter superfamily [Helianthus annuus]
MTKRTKSRNRVRSGAIFFDPRFLSQQIEEDSDSIAPHVPTLKSKLQIRSDCVVFLDCTQVGRSEMASKSTCPAPMKATSEGVFQGNNPLDYALPLVIVQICLVLVLTRVLAYLLKPLRQPRVIAEIIGGILLGPSALGRNTNYLHAVFPKSSLPVLDTLANLGLLFFLFLVGLELDLKSLRRTGKKALCVAMAGISLPFILGIGVSFVLRGTVSKGVNQGPFIVFMGVAMSITAFPVLARILAELKLLTTDVGKLAMSAAAVNDMAAWILLALAVALSGTGRSPLVALWVFLCGSAFIVLCSFVIPPVFKWMARRCPEGEPVDEVYVCGTLGVVLAAGFVTDAIGIHALFGAFVVGVLIPKEGAFAGALVEKVEDLVSGLFLPLYFVSSGLKTNVASIKGAESWGLLVLVICAACFGKIAGTVGVSLLCKIPFTEALALGLLMNTKGLVELIVLNIGKDRGVLNDQTFAILVLMALVTTFITTPSVIAVYKPAKKLAKSEYKHRTIYRKDFSTSPFRMFFTFHGIRNLPTIINLIEASRGTGKNETLTVHAMHLMELTERSSAILMAHKTRKNGSPFWKKGPKANSDQILVAFETFQQLSKVSIRPTTAISAVSSMHEDICNGAESKKAAMIVLPFHKHLRLDGHLEVARAEYRHVNRKVLEHAPCSVSILVDRGFGGSSHVSASNVDSLVTVLFFGGHDDHEALAYGARMAEHPGINLVVVRFLLDRDVASSSSVSVEIEEPDSVKTMSTDDEVIAEFKEQILKDSRNKYMERMVKNGDEVMEAVREHGRCNLVLVGRMPEGELVASMRKRSECPEMGPVGNLLIAPEVDIRASVLVVQQYRTNLSVYSLASLKEDEVTTDLGESDSS